MSSASASKTSTFFVVWVLGDVNVCIVSAFMPGLASRAPISLLAIVSGVTLRAIKLDSS